MCPILKALDGNIVAAFKQRSAYLEEVNRAYDPIQRIPAEVASSIFVFCLPRLPSLDIFDATPKEVQDDIALQAVQLLLGSICRRWRRIARSTPELWNVLWLQISNRTTVTYSQMVADRLRYSGQLPLFISVSLLDGEDSDNEDSDGDDSDLGPDNPAISVTKDIIDTLCHYIDRMKVLHLCLTGPLLKLLRNPIARTNNRMLEKLFIELCGSHSSDSKGHPLFDLAGGDSSPTHVSFREINYRAISIRWDNVTSLEAPKLLNYDALQILQLAPNLQVFKLSVVLSSRTEDPAKLPQVTHRSLQMLSLTWDATLKFLDFITCPAMNELSYHLPSNSVQSLLNFLGRSACVLKKISLESLGAIDSQKLLSVLWSTPSLTHLSLGKCGVPTEFLPCFAKTEFLPHLSSFSYSTYFDKFHWSDLLSLVSTRSRPTAATPPQTNFVRPLSQITVAFLDCPLDYYRSIDYATLAQILELTRDGIEVETKNVAGRGLISLSNRRHRL